MKRERALAGGGVALLLVMVLAAAIVPGAVAERGDDVRPGHVQLRRDVAVAPGTVTGESATLSLDVRLSHVGGPSENVTVEVRAIDAESNLLRTTERVRVGTVDGDREVPVEVNVTVPREGGYRFEVAVYADGQRVATGRTTVSGVGALTPAYARSPIVFERFEDAGIPTITYAVGNVSDGRVRLDTTTYLTNTGDGPAGDLRLLVLARQAESNIVADRMTVTVGEIRPGRTASVDAALTVPDDYNYRLDAMLLRDDVVLGVASANARLAPTKPMPANVTQQRIEIRASDFEGTGVETGGPEATRTAGASGPGFGPAVAVLALAVSALLIRRQS
ncbi:MAG: PGF-CTERM sorting domain-containing protein [Haloarculaceae archaeon]